jgi:hypothetical protein
VPRGVRIAHVVPDGSGVVADLLGQEFGVVLGLMVGEDDVSALGCELANEMAADAAGSSGDDDGSTGESEIHIRFLSRGRLALSP